MSDAPQHDHAVARVDDDQGFTEAEKVVQANLPSVYKMAALFRKQEAMAAAQLATLNWGASLDVYTRRAVAAWGREHDIDPATEIDVLGGRVYINSRYFYRKLAEMVAADSIEYAYADHVNADPRLEEMAAAGDEEARGESRRRKMLRIQHNVPEDARGAVVFRVKVHKMRGEVVGVKWTGLGKRNANGKLEDPIGDAKPVETAESRAMRRAMLKLAGTVRSSLADQVTATIESVGEIEPRISTALRSFEEGPQISSRVTQLATAGSLDPYPGEDTPPEPPHVTVHTTRAPARPVRSPFPDDEEQANLDRIAAAESGDLAEEES